MKPKLIVFDMAGTTVFDGDAVHRELYEAVASHGAHPNRDEINKVMGIAKPIAIRSILENHLGWEREITDAEVNEVHEAFLTGMLAHYKHSPEVKEVPGTTETFQWLRNAGIKVALDTGFDRVTAQTVLDRMGWEEEGLIDASVTSDEVERGRPYPDMILDLMGRFEITEPASVAKVGDTPSDLEEGTSAGCGWVIGVTEGSHSHEELQQYPHTHLISSVPDLVGLL